MVLIVNLISIVSLAYLQKSSLPITSSDQLNIDPVSHTDIAVNDASVEVTDEPAQDCDDDFVDVSTDWCHVYDLCDVVD